MIYFTADLHFGHANIIEYCNRPFYSVEDMDATLIENWNWAVTPLDTIYVVGDFTMKNKDFAAKILDQLNGYKVLIRGNHDRASVANLFFAALSKDLFIEDGGQVLYLRHRPDQIPITGKRSIFLHGHTHGTIPDSPTLIDVGVDSWDFKPVSLEKILDKIKELR